MKNTLLIVAVVILLIVGGAIFINASKEAAPKMTAQPTQTPEATSETGTEDPQMEETGNVKEITVTNNGFKFNPSTLTVNKGDKVVITFENTGGTHDFRIDGYNVGTNIINGGEEDEFEFTADKAGTFEYYCSVGNHRQMGMKGTLTVK